MRTLRSTTSNAPMFYLRLFSYLFVLFYCKRIPFNFVIAENTKAFKNTFRHEFGDFFTLKTLNKNLFLSDPDLSHFSCIALVVNIRLVKKNKFMVLDCARIFLNIYMYCSFIQNIKKEYPCILSVGI